MARIEAGMGQIPPVVSASRSYGQHPLILAPRAFRLPIPSAPFCLYRLACRAAKQTRPAPMVGERESALALPWPALGCLTWFSGPDQVNQNRHCADSIPRLGLERLAMPQSHARGI